MNIENKKYKHLFGPIRSRRLGVSLGIELVPEKICSIDCVYCEVGATKQFSVSPKAYVDANAVVKELTHYLKHNEKPNYVTITASGEPTLNANIHKIIAQIKENFSISICVITNGTLLCNKKIRQALMEADLVLPSLDAATEGVFKKINRPHKKLNFKAYVEGLIAFCNEFEGIIWLEVFILPGYNNHRNELLALKEMIQKIQPDMVQLNTLDRPGTLSEIRGATQEELQQIVELWQLKNVEIIAKAHSGKQQPSAMNLKSAIRESIVRRPCTVTDLSLMLGVGENKIKIHLKELETQEKLEKVKQERGVFYRIKLKS